MLNSIRDLWRASRDNLLWYGKRPWHGLFGHGGCQEFLDVERAHATESTTERITSHRCCDCGMRCIER